jgi:hypothetical protein
VDGLESFGVDLRGPDGNVVRVVRDAHGDRLWLYPRGSPAALPVERRACSQWKLELFSDPSDLLTPVGGSVSFTCAVDGRKIDGVASFQDCGS